jgi:hypothetical protein
MPRLTAAQWAAARADYEAGLSQNAVAEKHGVCRKAVQKHIEAEGWTQDVEPAIRRKVAEKVAGMVAACDPDQKAAAMDAEAERRAAVVERHRREWEGLEDLRQRCIRRAEEAEAAEDWGAAKVAKILADTIGDHVAALKGKQDGERRAWGLDDQAIRVDVSRLSDAELEALARGKG